MGGNAGRFRLLMRAIEHALSARREYMTKDGQIMQGGQTSMLVSCDESTFVTTESDRREEG